jgi:hypothetical protein
VKVDCTQQEKNFNAAGVIQSGGTETERILTVFYSFHNYVFYSCNKRWRFIWETIDPLYTSAEATGCGTQGSRSSYIQAVVMGELFGPALGCRVIVTYSAESSDKLICRFIRELP